jgi:UPF0755 protein
MGRAAVRIVLPALLVAALAVAAVALWGWDRYTGAGPLTEPRTVIIPKGAGVAEIAALLRGAGVTERTLPFRFGARVDGIDRALRAGEFRFPARVSPRAAARLIASGDTVKRRLTVAEGLTTAQTLALVAAADGLEGPVAASGIGEGRLLPETYFYEYGDSRAALVKRMRETMDKALALAWAGRDAKIAIGSAEDALVLASIIEKETGVPSERAMVSGVFHNRLRRGMRLQSDPTVAYGLSVGGAAPDRPLTRDDLSRPTPYNTYVIAGLPPGPIATPGRASLQAAVRPAETEALYFVADGDGGHVFARTLADHNRNVARWRRLLRERTKQGPEADAQPPPR